VAGFSGLLRVVREGCLTVPNANKLLDLAAIQPQGLAGSQADTLHFNELEAQPSLRAVREQPRAAGQRGQDHGQKADKPSHIRRLLHEGKSVRKNRRFEQDPR
jgi:hypothetical protein